MAPSQLEEILALVGPDINTLHTRREPINAVQRRACTFRCLASGDSMISISYAFRLGKTTVSHVLPLCIGPIDGKDVIIQAPPNSVSQFYN
ncbi:hypothetical protein QE152_g1113 [Popillia japonica]|uniref:Uncharacterized protein n=1 Tax=Popillia japonica TaxID=7064 RepID=A0AAW1NCG9_POPJA